MQTIQTRTEATPFPETFLNISCAGSTSPGKDMPTQPAPDPATDKKPVDKKPAPKKKK